GRTASPARAHGFAWKRINSPPQPGWIISASKWTCRWNSARSMAKVWSAPSSTASSTTPCAAFPRSRSPSTPRPKCRIRSRLPTARLPPAGRLLHPHRLVLPPLHPILVARLHKRRKQRMRLQRLRFELRVKLAAKEERMPRHLHDLHIGRVRSGPGNSQPRARQQRLVLAVEFVTVTVTF